MLQWPDLEIALGFPVLPTLEGIFTEGLRRLDLRREKSSTLDLYPLDLYPSLLDGFDGLSLYLRNPAW